tara:strand:- start:1141 stop:1512 length:372 start_codon:yes stop_codon:yes gene_type:complete
MSTFITTKTFHEVRKNGKVVQKKMVDATYDGKNAIIDTLENDVAHRFELSSKDIKKLLKQIIVSNKKNININALKGNSSIKEHLLTFDEKSTPESHKKSKKDDRRTRGRRGRRRRGRPTRGRK